SRSVVNYSCKRITYHTSLPFSEVRARLDRALNKSEASIQASKVLYETKTKAEFESGLTALLAGRDFIFLAELVHHPWVRTYTESPDIPQAVVYTLGNPFFGQSVLRRAMWMGLHVPEKLLLLEDPDGNGTTIIYDEPADIIPVP
ncbi:TT1751-like protein, partial [Cubamyces sp. BRFM 1775]